MPITGKILVVDDEEGILVFISLFLRGMKVEVSTALDGAEAMAKIRAEKFDLIISDIRMPRLTGIELYEEAKKFSPHYANRFIFVSGETIEQTLLQEMEWAGCPFLQKPFAGSLLWATVREMLKKRQPQAVPNFGDAQSSTNS